MRKPRQERPSRPRRLTPLQLPPWPDHTAGCLCDDCESTLYGRLAFYESVLCTSLVPMDSRLPWEPQTAKTAWYDVQLPFPEHDNARGTPTAP